MKSALIIILIIVILPFILLLMIRLKELLFDGSVNKKVSLDVVKQELSNMKFNSLNCKKCDLKAHDLLWFKFRTSKASWRHLAGREGFYCKCPQCKIVVDDIITVMN
jgi:hypothetical protein